MLEVQPDIASVMWPLAGAWNPDGQLVGYVIAEGAWSTRRKDRLHPSGRRDKRPP
jgi:hypothetical protein